MLLDVVSSSGSRSKSSYLSADLADYLASRTSRPDPVLLELIEETQQLGGVSEMQILPEQGTFISLLTAVSGARNAVEVGTFTGYSALCVARAMPADGKLLCLDVSEEWTSVARRYWDKAGVSDRIELKIGPAADSLAALPETPVYDLAFIDADKTSYRNYYELLLPRMRVGGLIMVDNVLQYGAVVRGSDDSPNVAAMKRFNDLLARDPRVEVVMLPVADGLTLARKL
jgi:predicted O-methyltransferase YrrM